MNNFGYGYQSMRPAPQVVQGLKGRPVSSLEEARAIPIDFDGSIFYFPDLANRCIYTKLINADGTASFNMYELREMPIVTHNNFDPNAYVSRTEFEEFVLSIKNMIQQPAAVVTPQDKELIKSF